MADGCGKNNKHFFDFVAWKRKEFYSFFRWNWFLLMKYFGSVKNRVRSTQSQMKKMSHAIMIISNVSIFCSVIKCTCRTSVWLIVLATLLNANIIRHYSKIISCIWFSLQSACINCCKCSFSFQTHIRNEREREGERMETQKKLSSLSPFFILPRKLN